jgi:Suppressor of fused protein (SUFU)
MWSSIRVLFTPRVTPADKLLNHFDRLARTEPRFVQVSDQGAEPKFFVAIYPDYREPDVLTGFTVGLSHFHPPGGCHKELVISMRDKDDRWALACGFTAFQLREHFRFHCGETIDFRAQIATSSTMSAFAVVHPLFINAQDRTLDLGIRQVELVQLVPVYEEERKWVSATRDLQRFLSAFSTSEILDPVRKPFVPPTDDSSGEPLLS